MSLLGLHHPNRMNMAQAVLGKTRKSQAQKSNTDGKTCAWPTSPFHARVEGKGRKGWSLPGGTLLVCIFAC